MTIPILYKKVLLRPADLEPSQSGYAILGTFNHGVARYGDDIILLVRVTEAPLIRASDVLVSPLVEWDSGTMQWTVDTFEPGSVDSSDPRILRLSDGRVRLRYISHLRLVRICAEDMSIKEIALHSDLMPCKSWEEFGIEDARITQVGETYYITYVAISRQMGVATALITTEDFQSFTRHGIIFPTENKDVVFLPEKWRGQFVAYHRPVSSYWIDAPSVETSLSPDSLHWGKHRFLFGPREGKWDSVRVGAGPPPLRLPNGWLLIYHGVSEITPESPVGRYCVGAALLDKDNPTRLVSRSFLPIICPEQQYEKQGFAPDVIFPTGSVLVEGGEQLLLFCGSADEVISMFRLSVESIMNHLMEKE